MTSRQISRSRAVRPYATSSRLDQVITARRLDGDRDLIFVPTDQRAGLENSPTGRRASRSRARKPPEEARTSTDRP